MATPVPKTVPLLYKVTVVPASADITIVGVLSVVVAIFVAITGCSGAVVSTVMLSALDADEVFPAASVAVTVNE